MQARGPLISAAVVVLLLATSGLLSSVAPAEAVRPAAAAKVAGCRHVELSPRPGWVSSGAWMKSGTELVVADARTHQVLSFDVQGKGFTTQPRNLTRALESFSPLRITSDATESRFFVELERDRFAVLDASGAFPLDRGNIRAESLGQASQGSRSLDKLFLWAPVNTDLLSYASVKEVAPGGHVSRWSGFVRFPIEHPDQFQPLVARNRDAAKIFYKLGHPLISSLGDTGYLIFLDNGAPGLYLNQKGSQELKPMDALDVLDSGKSVSPVLPSFIRPEDFPAVMRAVERSSMPVGLYGWADSLYVLFRSPGNGGTKWVMKKVDPKDDQIVASFEIPTRANHLTVVPGPREWAFIEKGPVRGHKDQDVNSILFVPTSRMQKISEGNLCR
jgi:hypothetical protein